MYHFNSTFAPSSIRLGAGIMALFVSATLSVQAATQQVTMKLVGKEFSHGKKLVVASGAKKTIFPSKIYQYKLTGSVKGKGGALGAALPNEVKFESFLTSINAGAAAATKILGGNFNNPSGGLGVTILNQTVTGSRNVKGFGKVSMKFTFTAKVAADGQISMEVTKVSIKDSKGKALSGSFVFGTGSTLVVSTAPTVEFKSLGQPTVNETAGTVEIIVTRQGNQKKAASVQFATVDGSAVAGQDYETTTGTVSFVADNASTPENENEQVISIPLIVSPDRKGFRSFTVVLSTPSAGAVLGEKTTTTVNIAVDPAL